MNLSLCITTFNRVELTLKSFEKVVNDPRISEIIIVDDCSTEKNFRDLSAKCFSEKITLYRNVDNLGMSRNKAKAISLAKNEWCIIFDSDNVLDKSYLDALEFLTLMDGVIYCPAFAKPNFDFRKFEGKFFDYSNIKDLVSDPDGNVLLNTCNYVVNRDQYDRVYTHNPVHKATDTVWFNYNWLKKGGAFFVVPGMHYEHKVHANSGFLQDTAYNMSQSEKLKHLILQL